MSDLIWKFRYARHFRKRLDVTWSLAWDDVESWIECYGTEGSPIDAAEESIDAWWGAQ